MTLSLNDIKAPIADEINNFEYKFRSFVKSKVYLLDKIMEFIIKRKGKQMRPMFVFLMAGTCGNINERTHRGAGLVELLHTATLVHDDVVDEANYRRNFFSINALWKNKIAVLVGDYLLSRGLLLSIDHKDFDFLEILSRSVKEMSEGELLQIAKARRLDITEKIYFDIIRQKTASLIATCCAVGACSTSNSEMLQKQAYEFGEKVGLAFQLKDDLFDYGDDEIGKPLGIDIKEKKMTLPLIYALNQATWMEKKRIIYMIKNKSHLTKKVREVISFVKEKGGIEYAKKIMHQYKDEALAILEQFPESDYRSSLKALVQYTIERKK